MDPVTESRPPSGPAAPAEEPDPKFFSPDAAVNGIDEEDWLVFNRLTSVELTPEERELASRPTRTAPEARECLAVHWHPEWAPPDLIRSRLALAFPKADNSLIIPTQHNRVLAFGPWAGVEADVYDRRYGLKVHLLVHFPADRLRHQASTFLAMMNRTYNYRAHQLLDILGRLADPEAAAQGTRKTLKCSVPESVWGLARFYALRLRTLIERSGILGGSRDEMLKNRLLPDFIQARGGSLHRWLLEQTILFINAVKKTVKAELNPEEFYSPQEVIEEARGLDAGVVIPHPPAFWPILLSDLDVDGWEIWNSSTPHHTLFLLEALDRANQSRPARRALLAFMGDDTHLSGKIRPAWSEEKDSASREIGFQDPWLEPPVQAALERAGQSLTRTLNEYRARLS